MTTRKQQRWFPGTLAFVAGCCGVASSMYVHYIVGARIIVGAPVPLVVQSLQEEGKPLWVYDHIAFGLAANIGIAAVIGYALGKKRQKTDPEHASST